MKRKYLTAKNTPVSSGFFMLNVAAATARRVLKTLNDYLDDKTKNELQKPVVAVIFESC